TAAKFLVELRKRIGEKTVIPVWTTECEEVDLPAEKNHGQSGTQLCGTVGCATGLCPERFSRQWSALAEIHSDPIALLALHRTFLRTQSQFGGGPTWVTTRSLTCSARCRRTRENSLRLVNCGRSSK